MTTLLEVKINIKLLAASKFICRLDALNPVNAFFNQQQLPPLASRYLSRYSHSICNWSKPNYVAAFSSRDISITLMNIWKYSCNHNS